LGIVQQCNAGQCPRGLTRVGYFSKIVELAIFPK
jgi:hypothetical protein